MVKQATKKAKAANKASFRKFLDGVRYSIIQDRKIVPFAGTLEELRALNPESVIRHVPLRKPSDRPPNLAPYVSQHIIDNAAPNSTKNCMIIIAVKVYLIEHGYDSWGWEVRDGILSFNMNHPGIGNNYTKFMWVLPPEVFDKTAEFDDKEKRPFIKPFSFKLNSRAATWRPGRKQSLRTKKNKPRDPNTPYGTKTPVVPGKCRPRRHLGRTASYSQTETLRLEGKVLGPKVMHMNAAS